MQKAPNPWRIFHLVATPFPTGDSGVLKTSTEELMYPKLSNVCKDGGGGHHLLS